MVTLCVRPRLAIVDTALMQKVPFKPLKSFTPVTAYAVGTHSALVVKSDAPWKTFKELTDYAKKNPGKIKYSTPGVGTAIHVAMEVVAHKDDIKWVHVPYKGWHWPSQRSWADTWMDARPPWLASPRSVGRAEGAGYARREKVAELSGCAYFERARV